MTASFPFPSVERLDRELLQVHPFETADVDIDLVGMRARNVIRVNPTHRTKIVLGSLGIELVERDLWLRSQKTKLSRIDNQVQKPFLRTDRTVTV